MIRSLLASLFLCAAFTCSAMCGETDNPEHTPRRSSASDDDFPNLKGFFGDDEHEHEGTAPTEIVAPAGTGAFLPAPATPSTVTDPFEGLADENVLSPSPSSEGGGPSPASAQGVLHLRPVPPLVEPYTIFHPCHPMNRKPPVN